MIASHGKLRFLFTKPKFLKLPIKQQHKKCTSMLRAIYDQLLQNQPCKQDIDHYNELQEWMEASPLKNWDLKSVSDRFHDHLSAANVSLKEHNLLPSITCKDKNEEAPFWPIAVYLDNIRSAHNVGSILRTVECLRLGTVYFTPKTPFVTHKQVKDSSMGTYQHVPCHIVDDISSLPTPIIVMETSSDAVSIHDYIFPESFTLVMGNEEYGCSEKILKQADHILSIPMRGRKNSLNVANAFSMAAHEIVRQRQV